MLPFSRSSLPDSVIVTWIPGKGWGLLSSEDMVANHNSHTSALFTTKGAFCVCSSVVAVIVSFDAC
jgi:hypothetical protein